MPEGIIYKALSGFYYVKSAELSEKTYRCTARGRFRVDKSTPLVGDRVEFTKTEQDRGVLVDILPRKNSFIRPPIANIDKLVIFASAALPITDPFMIDKMTVIALCADCSPVICINKQDINEADGLYDIYMSTGFPVIRTSAVTGDGISDLIAEVSGSLCAFCGNSGVGKSSILNAIEPDFHIQTGEISRKLSRGRHTTRHIELYGLSCGALVADTPGFSAFDTGFVAAADELQFLFPEFAPFLGECRFDDCAHIREPDCAVLNAVEGGAVHSSRHTSYVRLHEQASQHRSWE